MELRQYLKILRKNLALIIVFGGAGALIAFFLTLKLPSGYSQRSLFYLVPPLTASPTSYNFEGYYAQEKARNFTDTAVAILESADFTQKVVESNQSLSVRKVAPQVVRLSAFAPSGEAARLLIEKAASRFNQELNNLSGQADSLKIVPIDSQRSSNYSSPNRLVYLLSGFLGGFLFALLAIGLKVYFRL